MSSRVDARCARSQVSASAALQAAAGAKQTVSLWPVVSSLSDAVRAVARIRTSVTTSTGEASVAWNTVAVALRDVDRAWQALDCVRYTTGANLDDVPSGDDDAPNSVYSLVRAAVVAMETETAAVRLGLASHRVCVALVDVLPEGAVTASSTSCEAGA